MRKTRGRNITRWWAEDGGRPMLARAVLYVYTVLFLASLLLEQPIPLAIGP